MWLLYGLDLDPIWANDLIQVFQISIVISPCAMILRAVNIAGRIHDEVDMQMVAIFMNRSENLIITLIQSTF